MDSARQRRRERSDRVNRVLVTGASGFIGSHCLEPLVRRGYEVHAVSRQAGDPPVDGVTWHSADLLDRDQVPALVERVRATHLLHLAWYVTPGGLIDARENFDWTEASLQLLRAFEVSGGRRIVAAGSSYEYDWRYGYCHERLTPLAPDTAYGACKRALGELTAAFAENAGITSAWPRIFFLYGPREHPDRLVSSVVRNVLAESPAPCSHGEQIRDYLHVQDAADAVVAILDSDVQGPVNIGSGRPIELKRLVGAVGEKLGRPDLIHLGAIPARANDAPLVVADVARLTGEVGWAQRYTLDEGLDDTIAWWAGRLAEQAPA
jgi:nucleoside-diphosphate-sugar epimerase